MCRLFLSKAELQNRVPDFCVLACAGPVLQNTVDLTGEGTGDWKIDGASLEKDLGIKNVMLVNDFFALAYGLLALRSGPTSGHSDFAPVDETEMALHKELKTQLGCNKRISVDRIISEATIYSFLANKFPKKVDPEVHDEFMKMHKHQSTLVAEHAKTNELCRQTLEIFVGVYGHEAGNAMLKYLPRGGFYITGDLAAKNPSFFTMKDNFLNSLFDKGRVEPALRACPVSRAIRRLERTWCHLLLPPVARKTVELLVKWR